MVGVRDPSLLSEFSALSHLRHLQIDPRIFKSSDLLILAEPLRRLITRVADPKISGSGAGKINLICGVERLCDIARQFKMLFLILTNGHVLPCMREYQQPSISDKNKVQQWHFHVLTSLFQNCVIRFNQPRRATQLKAQASCACCGTRDWLKRIDEKLC